MTGVSQMYRNVQVTYKRNLLWWRRWVSSIQIPVVRDILARLLPKNAAADFEPIPGPFADLDVRKVHDCRADSAMDSRSTVAPTVPAPGDAGQDISAPYSEHAYQWAILVPITSRGKEEDQCFKMVESFCCSQKRTLAKGEISRCSVLLGIDKEDVVYDSPEAEDKLIKMFSDIGIMSVRVHEKFTVGYRGKLCWIWDRMARDAVKFGADFFVLLGDDVEVLEPGWKTEIEDQFRKISDRLKLPFGVGCVAFRDVSFSIFPTFPVLHKVHLNIFGHLFPEEFTNQHGDPFVFQIYRRWGASEFANRAALRNKIGGAGEARYRKDDRLLWRDKPLTSAIETLSRWLTMPPTHGCIDVVCPTYRCDVSKLESISSLKCEEEYRVSTSILLVVDNPGSSAVQSVQELQDWTANKWVRVHLNSRNVGASEARNIGHSQSFGDYVIFLDDDVEPDVNLLTAYHAATIRHPHARILVGSTKIPEPQTLMQHALSACQMTFFYNIADRVPNPPWGVTANMCVLGRTQNDVWFSRKYPKTGGGEDVDYCLRMKPQGSNKDEVIVSVPSAIAYHPFWTNILTQVVGWASGDVQCLDALPHSTYYTCPNWIECVALAMSSPSTFIPAALIIIGVEVFLRLPVARPKSNLPIMERAAVRLLSCVPSMAQDLERFKYKLIEMKAYQICLRFDWMDGQGEHSSIDFASELCKFVVRLIALALYFRGHGMPIISAIAWVVFIVLILLWCISQNSDSIEHFGTQGPGSLMQDPCATPFIVLAYQRTGSNLLCGILHNHTEIAMHNELFHAGAIMTYHDAFFTDWGTKQRDRQPLAFVNHVVTSAKRVKPNAQVVGFKLLIEHFSDESRPNELIQLLRDPRVKKVIVERRDKLAVLSSMMIAHSSNNFIGKKYAQRRLKISPAMFQRFLEHYQRSYDSCKKVMTGPCATFYYEDLVRNHDQTVKKLLRFLCVSDRPTPPLQETVKQQSEPLSEVITTWADLKRMFMTDNEFEDFLPDSGHI